MVSKSRTVLFLCGIFICLFLAACSTGKAELPTLVIDVEATQMENVQRTQAAETLSAALTQSAMNAALTASAPTATRTAPATRTLTPTITDTPFIGTANPTDTTLTPQASVIVLPSVTTAVPMWSCNIIKTSPIYKAELKKGQSFEAHWQLLNSGFNTWYNNNVSANYRNGIAMHTNDGEMSITTAVETGDIYEVVVPMKAPLEKGAYSTVWILENKDGAFCWFTVDIEVK